MIRRLFISIIQYLQDFFKNSCFLKAIRKVSKFILTPYFISSCFYSFFIYFAWDKNQVSSIILFYAHLISWNILFTFSFLPTTFFSSILCNKGSLTEENHFIIPLDSSKYNLSNDNSHLESDLNSNGSDFLVQKSTNEIVAESDLKFSSIIYRILFIAICGTISDLISMNKLLIPVPNVYFEPVIFIFFQITFNNLINKIPVKTQIQASYKRLATIMFLTFLIYFHLFSSKELFYSTNGIVFNCLKLYQLNKLDLNKCTIRILAIANVLCMSLGFNFYIQYQASLHLGFLWLDSTELCYSIFLGFTYFIYLISILNITSSPQFELASYVRLVGSLFLVVYSFRYNTYQSMIAIFVLYLSFKVFEDYSSVPSFGDVDITVSSNIFVRFYLNIKQFCLNLPPIKKLLNSRAANNEVWNRFKNYKYSQLFPIFLAGVAMILFSFYSTTYSIMDLKYAYTQPTLNSTTTAHIHSNSPINENDESYNPLSSSGMNIFLDSMTSWLSDRSIKIKPYNGKKHPINYLIDEKEQEYADFLSRQSRTIKEATSTYIKRYKQNPPPGFGDWFRFAKKHNSSIIDDYDSIYHSLRPFWGLQPVEIRRRGWWAAITRKDIIGITIENGVARVTHNPESEWIGDAIVQMMSNFTQYLPDMFLAFNKYDEPRVVVPNERMTQYLKAPLPSLKKKKSSVNFFSKTNLLEFDSLNHEHDYQLGQDEILKYKVDFNLITHQQCRQIVRLSCPIDTPLGNISLGEPDESDRYLLGPLGFTFNITAASDVCLSPSYGYSHGLLVSPNTMHYTSELVPIFSQSKMSAFNDIVYPSPWYWIHKVRYDESVDVMWDKKENEVYWRGSTTGGFSRDSSWVYQHRQNLVSIVQADGEIYRARTLEFDDDSEQWIEAPYESANKTKLDEKLDIKFSHVGQADDADKEEETFFFNIEKGVGFQDHWKYKYLLDMDGNAFSGRVYAFLKSNSAVIKRHIFREWHDDRFFPWVHYIPLSMQLQEMYEVIQWLFKNDETDAKAKRISQNSKLLANNDLRDIDLEIYFFRLLLEYARVTDDNRDNLVYFE